jgi:hypothetical protein
MDISFPRVESRILPLGPVELLVVVDRSVIRVAIDWSTIECVSGERSIDEDAVRKFIRGNRSRIELAIKAHLFAHGVPLGRQFVLTPDELGYLPA